MFRRKKCYFTATQKYTLNLYIPLISPPPKTMILGTPQTIVASHLLLPSIADAYFWLVVVSKFICQWPFKAAAYFFFGGDLQ